MTKIAKGESKAKLLAKFAWPSRILSYPKIVKVEGRKTNLLDFYTETHPILSKDSERLKQRQMKLPNLSMPNRLLFYTPPPGPRVAARGDTPSYRTPMRYPEIPIRRNKNLSIPSRLHLHLYSHIEYSYPMNHNK